MRKKLFSRIVPFNVYYRSVPFPFTVVHSSVCSRAYSLRVGTFCSCPSFFVYAHTSSRTLPTRYRGYSHSGKDDCYLARLVQDVPAPDPYACVTHSGLPYGSVEGRSRVNIERLILY